MARISEASDKVFAEAKNTNDLVKIMLPLTREKQDDVFVGFNGRNWHIQRGVEVEVPPVVKEILDNSERMDTIALNRVREISSKSKM